MVYKILYLLLLYILRINKNTTKKRGERDMIVAWGGGGEGGGRKEDRDRQTERDRETERDRDREKDRERERSV